ncbi:MAG: hypothetical protein ACRDZ7_08015, partial [Acidimicrobiia bacterium]
PATPPPVSPPAGPPASAAGVGTEVLGTQESAPAAESRTPSEVAGPPVPSVTEVEGATLPRTGPETRRGMLLAGGTAVMLGGLAVMGGNLRTRRRRVLPGRAGQ